MIFEKIQLEEDEAVIALIRRHWFYVFKQVMVIFVLMLMPVFVPLLLHSYPAVSALLASYTPHLFFLYAFWLLLLWMMLAMIWTDYYLDIWTITNRRIIKVDQIALFRRQTASFRLERLQDIHVEINGIIATLLDYGTIHAETASGHDDDFTAVYMPKPQEIKALILKASDALIEKTPAV